jgi:hypothetical protein
LDDLFGILAITRHAQREAVEAALIVVDDALEILRRRQRLADGANDRPRILYGTLTLGARFGGHTSRRLNNGARNPPSPLVMLSEARSA